MEFELTKLRAGTLRLPPSPPHSQKSKRRGVGGVGRAASRTVAGWAAGAVTAHRIGEARDVRINPEPSRPTRPPFARAEAVGRQAGRDCARDCRAPVARLAGGAWRRSN